mmetsp:Transcript_11111/g.33448  ORF Transcript_11111/g.33448 Transcript_11111/m.33448 type:complete len:211 (-) Transcript_11111:122-754(-)
MTCPLASPALGKRIARPALYRPPCHLREHRQHPDDQCSAGSGGSDGNCGAGAVLGRGPGVSSPGPQNSWMSWDVKRETREGLQGRLPGTMLYPRRAVMPETPRAALCPSTGTSCTSGRSARPHASNVCSSKSWQLRAKILWSVLGTLPSSAIASFRSPMVCESSSSTFRGTTCRCRFTVTQMDPGAEPLARALRAKASTDASPLHGFCGG